MANTSCILKFERLRLLGFVWMLCSSIYKKFFVHRPSQFVFGQHAFNPFFNNEFRFAIQHTGYILPALATWVTCMAHIFFLEHFVASEPDFFRINDDHIIARVNVRGERRFVLTHQDMRNAAEQAACRLSFSINDIPVALHSFVLRRFGIITPSIHDFMI